MVEELDDMVEAAEVAWLVAIGYFHRFRATSRSRSPASSLDHKSSALDEISRANRDEFIRPSDNWPVSTLADPKLCTEA